MNNTTSVNEERLSLQIRGKRLEADNIYSFDLVDPNGALLPPFCAGAHLEVYLAEGLVRHYSLSNSPSERGRYVIAVLKMESGRGGSLAMSRLQVGDTLVVSHPKNHFPMANTANHSVLIAGGIGITPILSMARALVESGQSFTLQAHPSWACIDGVFRPTQTKTLHQRVEQYNALRCSNPLRSVF